ncbi:DUF2798 domain-containing protein [Pseudomonas cavernicola]|uniref:DUF2798 domain-containing protein n=1 Tax=Pseudomonas cavernicola TaxID=2320866 RepID=A0A418X8B1_9PSED|nr:DUF2798 domain-containing protein [Pseudomonas cavernicola]RJG08729.1 DUF2798 domain-containing protein [Pseudomonas cavernicola]
MRKISYRYRQHTAAVIQSAITCAVATAIASPMHLPIAPLLSYWVDSWLLSWLTMVPVVLLATPWIRRMTSIFVQDDLP